MTIVKTMRDLLSRARKEPVLPRAGELIKGRIMKITNNELIIELGPLGTGIIYGAELRENRDAIKELEIGQEISALVIDPENEDGYIELSLKEATMEKTWADLKAHQQGNETVTVKVIEANRGGLVIRLLSVIGFLPVSQLSPENYPRVEGGDKNKILRHLSQFIGQEIQVKIIGLDRNADKLIVSEKAVQEKQIKADLSNYKKGDIIEGTVTALVDFGAFIKFAPNLEGLAHISELAWQIIDHPSQIVKEHDQVKAKIIDIQNGQVSLSLRALKDDPWKNIESKYQNGQMVEGKVIKFNPAGVFVQLDEGIHGLVRQSEFARNNGNQELQDALTLGELYNFEILSLTPVSHKMTLGVKITP